MNIDTFLRHHHLRQNPFTAEEARLDPVYSELAVRNANHPDFGKIVGRIDQPSTAVVFGEKGSGKTAIRLEMERLANLHNQNHDTGRVFTIAYDDLNPTLDRLMRNRNQDAEAMLDGIRLEDHQDAMLALGVTKLVDAVLDGRRDVPLPPNPKKVLRKLPKENRRDLALLAMLYDTPESGSPTERFHALRRKLRDGGGVPMKPTLIAAALFTLTTLISGLILYFTADSTYPLFGLSKILWIIIFAVSVLAALGLWVRFLGLKAKFWKRARRVVKQMPATARTRSELEAMQADVSPAALEGQPIPESVGTAVDDDAMGDARYQLTRKFLDVLEQLGYSGLLVLVDRMDEPTAIHGDADKMRRLVWPMFDNKFLKQDRVGLKLLLPVELSYLMNKESSDFYREARLDKQALIERLEWSGSTLYDLCSARLNAVRDEAAAKAATPPPNPQPADPADGSAVSAVLSDHGPSGFDGMTLTTLFEDDVDRDMLIDALDQMHQPRDAFKFMYQVLQEHCSLVPEETPKFEIARLTLDSVRREQSQRVQELYRGLGPA